MKLPGHAVFANYQTYTQMLSELLENRVIGQNVLIETAFSP